MGVPNVLEHPFLSFYLKSGYPAFAGPIRLIPQANCCTFSVSFPLKRLKKSLSTSLLQTPKMERRAKSERRLQNYEKILN